MADPKVALRLAELRAPAVKQARRNYGSWLKELEDVAFVKTEELEVKTPDKLKALELFGKATGYYQEKVAPAMNPLETAATDVLVTMLAEVRARGSSRESLERG